MFKHLNSNLQVQCKVNPYITTIEMIHIIKWEREAHLFAQEEEGKSDVCSLVTNIQIE